MLDGLEAERYKFLPGAAGLCYQDLNMAWPSSLDVGLKEWASVVAALASGRQIMLLRKGGILEQSVKNRFSITHNEFLLFPTYLHQSRQQLKSEVEFQPAAAEPQEVQLGVAGVVSDIVKVRSRQEIDRLDDQHIWTSDLIDMRFNYKPQNPLYLVLVRTYRLAAPATLANTPAFGGCKSWVPLGQPIATGGATAVLDDIAYEHRRRTILDRLGLTNSETLEQP
jgi:hypothetical protein